MAEEPLKDPHPHFGLIESSTFNQPKGLASLHLFEIKASASFPADFTRNLDAVRRAIPDVASATVVYGGKSAAMVRDIAFVPFLDLAAHMRRLGLA